MITLFLLMPFVALFMTANVAAGCYLAIRLGYGPPNWQTALNLVVRLTVLQNRLNKGRDWLEKKAPWADKILTRLNVPKPFIIIDVTAEDENDGTTFDEQIEELSAMPIEELLADDIVVAPQQESEPVLYDEALISALSSGSTDSWFINDKNAETSLLKLNTVLMKSGRFAAELEKQIRSVLDTITENDLQKYIASFRDDCKKYLLNQSKIVALVQSRIDEFGEFKTLAEESAETNAKHTAVIEATINDLASLSSLKPKEGAAWLLQQLTGLRRARHQLRDMRERVFTLVAAKEHRLESIPKQLFIDEISGLRGRIGLTATLYDWWKNGRQQGRLLTFALADFVKFGELNDEQGILTGNKIIKHFATVLKEHFDAGDLFGVYYGNAFLTVTINTGLQQTIAAVERIRQKQMKTVYYIKEMAIPNQVLLTGAVVETSGTQSVEEVLDSLDKTMAAAKAAGRNHTFCLNNEAKQPEKVESPDFDEPEQKVVLE